MKQEISETSESIGPDTSKNWDCESTTFVLEGIRYYVTQKRWGVLLLTCLILSTDIFCYYFFSFVNDVTSEYFQVDPAMTDLLASVNMLGRIAGGIIVCFVSDWMKSRNIAVYGSAANCVACTVIAAGVYLKLFGLAIAGMFLNGFASGILITLIQTISVTWFPLKERGKATAAPFAMRRMSMMLSNVVATRSLRVYNINTHPRHVVTSLKKAPDLMPEFQVTYTAVFGIVALLSLLCCVVAWFYITERPAICLSNQDSNMEMDETSTLLGNEKTRNFGKECKELISLVKNRSVLLFLCVYFFVMMDDPLGSMLISSLVTNEFSQINDRDVGIAYCVGIVIGVTGAAIAGQVLDKFCKPRITIISFAIIAILALSAFSLCFHFHVIIGVLSSYLVLWSTRDALSVCMSHRLSAITIDRSHSIRVKAFCISIITATLSIALTASIVRFLADRYSTAMGVAFPLPFLVISIYSYVFLWSHFQGPGE